MCIRDRHSSDCSIKVLCLNEAFKMPQKVNCASIDTLIVSFFKEKLMPTISFAENFTNLKSLRLEYVILSDDGTNSVSYTHLVYKRQQHVRV